MKRLYGMPSENNATSSSARLAHFVSVTTGEILDESKDGHYIDVDRGGTPTIGDEEDNAWWGTEDAAYVISETYYTTQVYGYQGKKKWVGHFIGTMEEIVRHCDEQGIWILEVRSGA